jgi:5-methyltetrahydrofolate--homocysteine methyltransferase
MEPLLSALRRGEPLIGDGAIGTMLMERGLKIGECFEAFNTERPEVLLEIAALYLEAGAEILTSNTFGGSPLRLRAYSLEGETERINGAAVELLLNKAGGNAYVAGDVGPTGALLKPYGDVEEGEVAAAFERQIAALAAAGADLILIETMIDLREATLAVRAAKQVAPALPVLATMTFDATPRGFFTVMGESVEQAAAGLQEAGADAIGSNCGNGVEKMVAIAREFAKRSELPLVIQSNAGLPENRGGQVVYPETPEFMANELRSLIRSGVAVIGGCCGTTPEHIRAIARCVKSA